MANRFTLVFLGSPVHDLLSSSTALLTHLGRRSGAARTIPVNYLRDGDRLLVTSLRRRRWWHDLRDGRAVSVRLAGADRTGIAEILDLAPSQVSAIVAREYRELASGREPAGDRAAESVAISPGRQRSCPRCFSPAFPSPPP